MKWIIRTWVFGISLVLGVSAAALVDLLAFEPSPVSIEEYEKIKEMPNAVINGTGVRVTYMGWKVEASEPYSYSYLEFLVQNDSWEPLSYWGHNSNDMLTELRSNGKEIELMGRCGTGMGSHILLPGASAVVRVPGFEFRSRPAASDLITAGFSLRRPFEDRATIFWSQPILLSEEFRMAIETR
jgi:hypothetical protein